jgi:hypothetical protein
MSRELEKLILSQAPSGHHVLITNVLIHTFQNYEKNFS